MRPWNIRQKKSIQRIFIICLIVCACSMLVPGSENIIYAAESWTSDADQGIYDDNVQGENETSVNGEEKDPSKIEKWVAGMISGLSTGINKELAQMGMSLDQVVCGRVGSGGKDVAMFTFELVRGNPYGTISAAVYVTIRSIIFIIMALLFTGLTSKAMLMNGTGASREKYKTSISTFAWTYGLLYLMPYLLDLCLYIRDQLLYAVLVKLGALVSSASGGSDRSLALIGHFKDLAETTPTLTNALMYFGAVCITFYFIFEYAGMAMAMLLMMLLFPFMCVKVNMQRGALEEWVWDVFSTIITPILDLVLLMVPILMGAWFPQMWLLKMVCCGLVIPSRNVAKRVLGLSSAGAGLMNGVMAAMALRSIGGMAKKGKQKVSDIVDSIKNGRADKEKQRYHEDMASAEGSEEKDRMRDADYGEAGKTSRGRSSFGKGDTSNQNKKKSNIFGFGNKNKKADSSQTDDLNEGDNIFGYDSVAKGSGAAKHMDSAGISSMDMEGKEHTGGAFDEMGKAATGETKEGIAKHLNHTRNTLGESVQANKKKIASLNRQKAGLEQKNANMRLEEARSGGRINNAEKIAKNKSAIAGMDASIAGARESIAENEARMSEIDSGLNAMGVGKSGNSSGNITDIQRAIMQKHANIDNFENPEFSGLSHADKAKLYQKRAKKQFASAAAQSIPIAAGAVLGGGLAVSAGLGAAVGGGLAGAAIGSTGSFSGALMGMGAGMFYGPAMAAQTVAIGSSLGGVGTSAVTGVAGAVINKMNGKNLGDSAQRGRTYMPLNSFMSPNIGDDVVSMMNSGPNVVPFGPSGVSGISYIGENHNNSGNYSPPSVSMEQLYNEPINYSGMYQSLIGSSGTMADANRRADSFINSSFLEMQKHISGKLDEGNFKDKLNQTAQNITVQEGFRKTGYNEQHESLCRGMAGVFADEGMQILGRHGISAGTAEYTQIRTRLIDTMSKEKTLQMQASMVLEQERLLREEAKEDILD